MKDSWVWGAIIFEMILGDIVWGNRTVQAVTGETAEGCLLRAIGKALHRLFPEAGDLGLHHIIRRVPSGELQASGGR